MTVRVLVLAGRFAAANAVECALAGSVFDVAVATRGEDVLASARLGLCDVAILDARDPDLDPFALCRLLKGTFVPVLMITDRDRPWQRLSALDAGADECLSAPSPDEVLIGRVRSLAEAKQWADAFRRSAALQGTPAECPAPVGRPPVLLLDPDGRSSERLRSILGAECALYYAREPGPELDLAARAEFDLALVCRSWAQPETLRHIRFLRRNPRRALRIILIDGDEWPAAAPGSEADDGLTRPIDRSEALARVRLALRKQRLARACEEAAPPHASSLAHRPAPAAGHAPPDRFAA